MERLKGILIGLLITATAGYTQQTWTLQDCIDYALENNIQLKRQKLVSESARNNYSRSMIGVLPSVYGFANHDFNSGRALNYDTYQWENREFQQGNLGIQGRVNVFSGFQNYNNIQQHRFLLLSRLEEVERAKNDISLNISAAYFQILLDKELLDIAESQLEVSSLELEAARINYQVGNIPGGRLLEIESQVAADEYQLTLAGNNLNQSYLDLVQMMQLDNDSDFRIAVPEKVVINEGAAISTVDNIYDEAEAILPQVRVAEYMLKSREKELAVARGLQSPRLSLQGTLYSRYSELAVNPVGGAEYPYSTQIRDNRYRQLGVSLSIPIFEGWTTRNRISNAKVSVLDAQYQLDETRQNLYMEIHQMHNSTTNSYNRYKSAEKAVAAAQEAFNHSREQFGLGLINFVDYQHVQASFFRAQSNMVQAKYEYFLRSIILDFYLGEPLAIR
ncbi:MAG: TolC family protein [Marinilabiliales bacterium]|nr:MAG: TolC family protein [Marinilabiliales bacterium]